MTSDLIERINALLARQDLTFAECTLAEEWCSALMDARDALVQSQAEQSEAVFAWHWWAKNKSETWPVWSLGAERPKTAPPDAVALVPAPSFFTAIRERDEARAERDTLLALVKMSHKAQAVEKQMVRALTAEALVAKLVPLATHANHCGWRFGHDCDCGLDEIRKSARSLADTALAQGKTDG